MATFYTHRAKNITKTWILVMVFFAIVIGIGYYFSQTTGDLFFVVIAIAISAITNVVAFWRSDKVVVKMSGAKLADKNEYGGLHNIVENISIAAGLPRPKVYIIHDPAPNAFATGRNSKNSLVAVTTGLYQMLKRTELEGVIAHEMSHIGNKDMLVSTMVVILAGSLAMIANMFTRMNLLGASNDGRRGGINIVVALAVAILAPLSATLIRLAISRKREFLADATAVKITRYPDGLIGALKKIDNYSKVSGAQMMKASNAMAHLYFVSPFGTKAFQGIQSLFLTHPKVEKRIAALESMGF